MGRFNVHLKASCQKTTSLIYHTEPKLKLKKLEKVKEREKSEMDGW